MTDAQSVVGVDFGAPRRARDQKRKIIAIAARAVGRRHYRVDVSGFNARLVTNDPPGWTAKELIDELVARPLRVAAFDFPFGLPDELLRDEGFAAQVGFNEGAFLGWRAFSQFVANRLPLADVLDFRPFDAWRSREDRARLWTRRATDVATRAQPPLKDLFQATFQMTLLGNALLSRLWESHRYRVLPFAGGRGDGEVIEVYPAATLRHMGMSDYKARPAEAVELGLAACADAGIAVDADPRVKALCCRYSSGSKRTPDHDAADAFVALCTAILHAEGACRPAEGADLSLTLREGAIWIPRSAPTPTPGVVRFASSRAERAAQCEQVGDVEKPSLDSLR